MVVGERGPVSAGGDGRTVGRGRVASSQRVAYDVGAVTSRRLRHDDTLLLARLCTSASYSTYKYDAYSLTACYANLQTIWDRMHGVTCHQAVATFPPVRQPIKSRANTEKTLVKAQTATRQW